MNKWENGQLLTINGKTTDMKRGIKEGLKSIHILMKRSENSTN
jgi:hypothetical protein